MKDDKLVNGITLAILLETDLEAAMQFYKDLGLRMNFYVQDKWADFSAGGIKLGLCPFDPSVVKEKIPPRRSGLVFEVADMDKIAKFLEEKGLKFVDGPRIAPHGIMASIQDPGGNIIDLYKPTPVSSDDITISESAKS